MSRNIFQVYTDNPITSNAATDLVYFGQSPYGVGDDAAMTYANFAAQFSTSTLPNNQIFVGSASNIATAVTMSGDASIINTGALTITNNAVTFAKMQMIAGLSVIGRSANTSGNVAEITASMNDEILRVSSNTLGFGSINLASSNAVGSSILPIANGGTNSSSQVNGGIAYYNNTSILTNSPLAFNGLNNLNFTSSNPALNFTIYSNTPGGSSHLTLSSGDTSGDAQIIYANPDYGLVWAAGIYNDGTSSSYYIRNLLTTTNAFKIDDGTNAVTIDSLSINSLVATNGSKELISGNLSGDVVSTGLVTNLVTVNSDVGTFGSSTQVGAFTVTSKGQVTSAGNITISGVAPGGAAGGDLSGTYPNPSIASLAVTNAKIANATIDLTTKVTGILPIANGGTNASSQTNTGINYFSSGSIISSGILTFNTTNTLSLSTAVIASGTLISCINTDNTDPASRSVIQTRVGGSAAGDPFFALTVGGTQDWSVGIDNSDSDSFIIGTGFGVGSGTALKITTAGVISIPNLTASSLVATDASKNLTSTTTTINGRLLTLGLGAAVSAPSLTSQLNVFSTNQTSIRIVLSGQEYTAPANTSNDGVAFVLGINRSNNKQLWIADSSRLASSSTNPIFRITIAGSTTCGIGCLATDGTTGLPMALNSQGGDVSVGENGAANLSISTAGSGLRIKEGSNAKQGITTLVAGTAVVSNTSVTANSRIFLTPQNTSGTASYVYVSARVASTSFTILSGSALDTRDIAWEIFEPA